MRRKNPLFKRMDWSLSSKFPPVIFNIKGDFMTFEEVKRHISGAIDNHVCSNAERLDKGFESVVNNNFFFSRESEERMVLAMCQRMEKNN